MEIRPLRKTDDRLAISRIYEESWKFAYRDMVPQAYLDSIPAGQWAPALDHPGRETLVMTEGDRLIGTSSLCPSRWRSYPDFGEIVSLYLLPAYMGRGYGGPLLAAAVRKLERQGFRNILLWVLEENRRARAFYEKNNFRPGGASMESDLGGRRLKEILYCRYAE